MSEIRLEPLKTPATWHGAEERKRHMLRLRLTAHGNRADGDALVQQGIPKKAGVVSDANDITHPS